MALTDVVGIRSIIRSAPRTRPLTCDQDANAVVQAGRDRPVSDDVLLRAAASIDHAVQGPGNAEGALAADGLRGRRWRNQI